jgi:hypothetical protein
VNKDFKERRTKDTTTPAKGEQLKRRHFSFVEPSCTTHDVARMLVTENEDRPNPHGPLHSLNIPLRTWYELGSMLI